MALYHISFIFSMGNHKFHIEIRRIVIRFTVRRIFQAVLGVYVHIAPLAMTIVRSEKRLHLPKQQKPAQAGFGVCPPG